MPIENAASMLKGPDAVVRVQVVMLLLQNAAQPRIPEAMSQLRTHLKLFEYSSLPAPPAFKVCRVTMTWLEYGLA